MVKVQVMSIKAIVLVISMICVTILECVALLSGINGTTFAAALGYIATIAGYLFRQKDVEVLTEE